MIKKIHYTRILSNAFYKFNINIISRNYTFLILFAILLSTNIFAQADKDGALTINTFNTVLSRYAQPTAVCYKPAATVGAVLETKMGITALSRAGAADGNWPMVRTGAHVALEAKTKGFVPTRIANPATAIANPVDGMMVYDTTLNCLRIYTVDSLTPANTGWKCFDSQTCPD